MDNLPAILQGGMGAGVREVTGPNDHAEGNTCPCFCARNRTNQPIFDRLGIGVYEVR